MKQDRKRIFGRLRTEVDTRTPGIRVASNTRDASGDRHSSQVVHTTASQDINKWAAFLPALNSLQQMGEVIFKKNETEEERRRRKAEAEMDERLKQLQAWDADKWTMDLKDRLDQQIDGGNITSFDQAGDWIRAETDWIDSSRDAAFIQQARGRLGGILEQTQVRLADKARQEFDATVGREVQDGIAKAFTTQDLYSDEGRVVITDAITKGRELFVTSGKSELEFDEFVLKSAHQAARNANLMDRERTMAILDYAETITGGYEATSTLRTELETTWNQWSEQEEAKSRKDEAETWQTNRIDTYSRLVKMTRAERQAFSEQLRGDPEMTMGLYGSEILSVFSDIQRFDDIERIQDQRVKQAKTDQSELQAQSYIAKILNGENLSKREILDDEEMLVPHKLVVLEQMDSEDARMAKEEFHYVELGMALLSERYQKDAKIMGEFNVEPGSPQRDHYGAQVRQAVREIKREDFEAGPLGDQKCNAARTRAVNDAVTSILDGKKETLFSNPLVEPKDESSTPVKAAAATYEDYQANPTVREDLEKRLFSGSESITVGRSPSGRPYTVAINRKYYDSISDPLIKKEAQNLIRQRQADKLASETADNWWVFTLSTDAKRENEWRFGEIAAAEKAGDKNRASRLRTWFGMVDGTVPMDESQGKYLFTPPEIE